MITEHFDLPGMSVFSELGEQAACRAQSHCPPCFGDGAEQYGVTNQQRVSSTGGARGRAADVEDLSDFDRAFSPIPFEIAEAWPTEFPDFEDDNSLSSRKETSSQPVGSADIGEARHLELKLGGRKRPHLSVDNEAHKCMKKFANPVPRLIQKRQDMPKLPKRPLTAVNFRQREIRAKAFELETTPPKAFEQFDASPYWHTSAAEKHSHYQIMEEAERERYLCANHQFYNCPPPPGHFEKRFHSTPAQPPATCSAFSPLSANSYDGPVQYGSSNPQDTQHHTGFVTEGFPEPILMHGKEPVLIPPSRVVEIPDASGVPRRYQVMYAAITMPLEDAQRCMSKLKTSILSWNGQS